MTPPPQLPSPPHRAPSPPSVLYHVRAVFFNQLSAWCLHGLLDDPGREFFIRAARDRGTAVGATGAAAETDEEAALAAVDEFEWHGAYSVEPELVPSSHLSHALTDDVLFAGRAVSLVQDAARRGSHRSHFSEEDAAACGQALDAARNTHPFSALEVRALSPPICTPRTLTSAPPYPPAANSLSAPWAWSGTARRVPSGACSRPAACWSATCAPSPASSSSATASSGTPSSPQRRRSCGRHPRCTRSGT